MVNQHRQALPPEQTATSYHAAPGRLSSAIYSVNWRFEPTASSSPNKRAAKLRHTPLEAYRTGPLAQAAGPMSCVHPDGSARIPPAPQPARPDQAWADPLVGRSRCRRSDRLTAVGHRALQPCLTISASSRTRPRGWCPLNGPSGAPEHAGRRRSAPRQGPPPCSPTTPGETTCGRPMPRDDVGADVVPAFSTRGRTRNSPDDDTMGRACRR